jgi:hypothetical protein
LSYRRRQAGQYQPARIPPNARFRPNYQHGASDGDGGRGDAGKGESRAGGAGRRVRADVTLLDKGAVALAGDTYPIRNLLKAMAADWKVRLGWEPRLKAWIVSSEDPKRLSGFLEELKLVAPDDGVEVVETRKDVWGYEKDYYDTI